MRNSLILLSLKNAILFIRTRLYKFVQYILCWLDFYRSIKKIKNRNEIWIFSNCDWHYGWDYQSRRFDILRENAEDAIFLRLDDWLMIFIATLLFKKKKFHLGDIDTVEIQSLNIDITIRKLFKSNKKWDPVNFSSCEEYIHFLNKKSELNKMEILKFRLISGIFREANVKGLIISQTGLEDWVYAAIAFENNKRVFETESLYGFFEIQRDFVRGEKDIFDAYRKFKTISDNRAAEVSLKNKCEGRYEQTNFSSYHSSIQSEDYQWLFDSLEGVQIIFYAHAFTDAPNALTSKKTRSNYFLDYFSMTWRFIDFCVHKNISAIIKLHPSGVQYPLDFMFDNKIQELCKNHSNLTFITKKFPLSLIKRFNRQILIATGRGSITLEAAYLGFSVLNLQRNIYTEIGVASYLDLKSEGFVDLSPSACQLDKCKDKSILIEGMRLSCQPSM